MFEFPSSGHLAFFVLFAQYGTIFTYEVFTLPLVDLALMVLEGLLGGLRGVVVCNSVPIGWEVWLLLDGQRGADRPLRASWGLIKGELEASQRRVRGEVGDVR